MDKIGEVIGPKGKVINALQQETGADIAVDDDGLVGTVTIGAKDGGAVAEAKRRIYLILDPPDGRGGRRSTRARSSTSPSSGRSSTSSPAATACCTSPRSAAASASTGSRTCSSLGQDLEVKVDDIDPQGKVSLSLAGEPAGADRERRRAPSATRRAVARARAGRRGRAGRVPWRRGRRSSTAGAPVASFEDAFEAELVSELGDLGPGPAATGGGGDRGERRRPSRRRPRRRSRSPASSSAVSAGRGVSAPDAPSLSPAAGGTAVSPAPRSAARR